MKRRWLHTTVLTAAGSYNLTWGGWVAVHPSDLYQAAGIPAPNHPEIAGVLGMVIALYGILYLHAAAHPEHGWPIVAIGLLGKVIGPVALLWHITTGAWPTDSLAIIIFNDLLWWAPFALYLHDTRHALGANARSGGQL